MVSAWEIKAGSLQIPQQTDTRAWLTPELEKYYSFREEAVYSCRPDPGRFPSANVWQN